MLSVAYGWIGMGMFVVVFYILSDLVRSDGFLHGFSLLSLSLFSGLPSLAMLFGCLCGLLPLFLGFLVVFLVLGVVCGWTMMGLIVVGFFILLDLVGSNGVLHGFALFPFTLFSSPPCLDLLFGFLHGL